MELSSLVEDTSASFLVRRLVTSIISFERAITSRELVSIAKKLWLYYSTNSPNVDYTEL